MNYQKGLKPGYGIGYQGLFRDERDDLIDKCERLEAEVEALRADLESDADGEKRRAYWRIANNLLDYLELCNDKNVVPLKHDINIHRAQLNAARRKG